MAQPATLSAIQQAMAANPNWPAALRNDPQIQQILLGLANATPGVGGTNMTRAAQATAAITARAAQLGVTPPQGQAFTPVGLQSTGGFQPWQLALLVGGGLAAASVIGGAGAAGAGSSSAAGGSGAASAAGDDASVAFGTPGVVNDAATIPAGGGITGANVGLDAGAAGTGAASSFLTNPWTSTIIGGAVDVGKALITNNAIKSAQTAQAQATGNAVANNAEIYNQNRAALQPFIAGGTGALNTLASLYGIAPTPTPAFSTIGPSQNPVSPPIPSFASLGQAGTLLRNPAGGPTTPVPGANYNGQTGQTGTSLASMASPATAPAGTGTVPMRAPDGSVENVPVALVSHYQALGAQVAPPPQGS